MIGNFPDGFRVPPVRERIQLQHSSGAEDEGRTTMEGLTGFAAVIMLFGMPTAVLGMYTFYRVRKLRTEERLAAMQRGVNVPIEAELSESARSRRAGILLVAGSVGYMLAFS